MSYPNIAFTGRLLSPPGLPQRFVSRRARIRDRAMSSQKKVIVRRFLGDSIAGYLPHSGFIDGGMVSLLDLAGRLTPIALLDLKFIAYVRDFNLPEASSIEHSLRRSYLARPRSEGLWVKVTFRSGDQLEGLASSGLPLIDEILDANGLHLTPPDPRANTQRVYVPRAAMRQLDLLGVISSAARQRSSSSKARPLPAQDELFGIEKND